MKNTIPVLMMNSILCLCLFACSNPNITNDNGTKSVEKENNISIENDTDQVVISTKKSIDSENHNSDTIKYIDYIGIRVDSITTRCKLIISNYQSSGKESSLTELGDILKKLDGAVSESVGYNLTKYILENNLLCDLLAGFSLLNNKQILKEFIGKIRYSQVYFPEYCKKKKEFNCYETYKSILEEICNKK